MIKKGTKVVMVNCGEAEHYGEKEWITRSDSYMLGKEEVVLLEGYSGAFLVDCLLCK